ncbi:N-formylglutamate amidohydrolase [Clostridium sp. Marseille-P2415]|uniref:N-formylglutamate amidohydrolase n=1 Tax=Clostridium sp. Marseille-P2415 TaxID=1805471 RepID=UPI000988324F|nr:N-formylglutamate amidohydrolase [Clostridium sp. Marseille-P2415]
MDIYNILNANSKSPIIVSFPHSGTYVPDFIKNSMRKSVVLTNMDWFLPELFDFLNAKGITQIISNVSRYVVDLNRDSGNLNPDNYKQSVIYETNTFGTPLYENSLNKMEIAKRIETFYKPYHEELRRQLESKILQFEKVYLIDMHSFFQQYNEDICLGNSDGATSGKDTMEVLKKNLQANGFSTNTNSIFKGGNTIKYYRKLFGNAFQGLILEINYRAYIDNRYFGEEEVVAYNKELFKDSKGRLEKTLEKTFDIWTKI